MFNLCVLCVLCVVCALLAVRVCVRVCVRICVRAGVFLRMYLRTDMCLFGFILQKISGVFGVGRAVTLFKRNIKRSGVDAGQDTESDVDVDTVESGDIELGISSLKKTSGFSSSNPIHQSQRPRFEPQQEQQPTINTTHKRDPSGLANMRPAGAIV